MDPKGLPYHLPKLCEEVYKSCLQRILTKTDSHIPPQSPQRLLPKGPSKQPLLKATLDPEPPNMPIGESLKLRLLPQMRTLCYSSPSALDRSLVLLLKRDRRRHGVTEK